MVYCGQSLCLIPTLLTVVVDRKRIICRFELLIFDITVRATRAVYSDRAFETETHVQASWLAKLCFRGSKPGKYVVVSNQLEEAVSTTISDLANG